MPLFLNALCRLPLSPLSPLPFDFDWSGWLFVNTLCRASLGPDTIWVIVLLLLPLVSVASGLRSFNMVPCFVVFFSTFRIVKNKVGFRDLLG